jgi:hypothetical protein
LIVLVVVDLMVAGVLAWLLPQVRGGGGMGLGRMPWLGAPYARPDVGPRRGSFFLVGYPLWGFGRTVATEIFLFVGGGLVLVLFPGLMGRLAGVYGGPERRNVFVLLGIGVLGMLLLGVLVGLGALSLLGLPAVPLLLLLMGLVLVLGLVASVEQVGRGVCSLLRLGDERTLVHLLLGVATVSLVMAVPILNGVVLGVGGVWGAGALLVVLLERQGRAGSLQAPVGG